MDVIIDTNRIIAALLKDGASRKILFDLRFSFMTPTYAQEEIERHRSFLQRKAHLTDDDFDAIVAVLFRRIRMVEIDQYKRFLDSAGKQLSDPDDTPFLALAMAVPESVIWSDDKVFMEQKRVRVLTTKKFMETVF